MLQGQARGKVGDLVFYVRNGGQQTRVRNRAPENPRTQSQMHQRVKLASVVGFYKRQASFFRFALKKSQKESYYNAFVRYNINTSPYLTKEEAAQNVAIPAPYVIADGNMPRLNIVSAMVDEDTTLVLNTDISSSWNTWGDMRRGLSLIHGDMLTLVVFNSSDDATDPSFRIVSQHRFDSQSEDMEIGYDMVGTSWAKEAVSWECSVSSAYFGLNEFYATGSALILSRNDGQVDCSYAKLFLDLRAKGYYLNYRTSTKRDEAAASYGREKASVLDPKQFEGNYVDMVTFYSDFNLTTPIEEISLTTDSSKDIYYDPSKFGSVESIDDRYFGGADVMQAVQLTKESHSIEISSVETAVGTGSYGFNFLDSNGNVIGSSVLKITTFE